MPGDPAARLARFRQEFPGVWETLTPQQRQRITNAASATGTWADFAATVSAFPFVSGATTGGAAPPAPPPVEGFDWVWNGSAWQSIPNQQIPIEEPPPVESVSSPTNRGEDIRQTLIAFLNDNDLPQSLMAFINDALAQGMGAVEIVARLRQTPEYKAAYPENDLRKTNGFSWMPESQIRAMRDEIKRLTGDIMHVSLTPAEIATIIAKDKSLSEWEGQLKDYQTFQRWGPTVQTVLSWELGHPIPDERAFALLSTEMSTPELATAYERALLRGQPAILGLGIRPEAEAEMLRKYGINPDQAFKGYQGIVGEMPAAERFAGIERTINGNLDNFPTGTDLFNNTPFATLFRAIQLGDAQAIQTLQSQMAREVARYQAGGGASQAQGGASTGLLEREQRLGV